MLLQLKSSLMLLNQNRAWPTNQDLSQLLSNTTHLVTNIHQSSTTNMDNPSLDPTAAP